MANNLIVCPVGMSMPTDPRWKDQDHWRWTHNERDYETLLIVYNDFEPEPGSYDHLIRHKGHKWQIMKAVARDIPLGKYNYIGCVDDDLITDIQNLNRAFELAKERNLKVFQLSVTNDSDVFYPILRNQPGVKYTKTNFIEVMGPVIHTSLIPLCLDLWNKYEIYSGWGFDKVLCDLTKEDAAVIHCSQMYHPKKESSYDKSDAFAEMDKLLYDVFPKFMKEHYNEEWNFTESQVEKEIILEV